MPKRARLLKYLARRGFEISSRSQFVFSHWSMNLYFEPSLKRRERQYPLRPCVNRGATN